MLHSLHVLVLALSIQSGQLAVRYESSLGFSATVPVGWLAITEERLKREPDLFDRVLKRMVGSDPGLASSLRAEVQAGELDVLLRAEPEDSRFVDNINIRGQLAKLALSRDVVLAVCEQLMNPPEGTKSPVDGLKECAFREVAGRPALFMKRPRGSTTTLQFQILVTPTRLLAITAVAKSETIDVVGDVLEKFVQSLEFAR
ncbi:MAG: hypothetical protein K8F56_16330 [Rhodocyclaceae bacterium]|nr:hypothetical protein [Rhodocyclaceae bacterium]